VFICVASVVNVESSVLFVYLCCRCCECWMC